MTTRGSEVRSDTREPEARVESRESRVARLAERELGLNVDPELEADMATLRRTHGIPPGGILAGILEEHPEWGNSLARANGPLARRERRLLADPWVRAAVEDLVRRYRFPLRGYLAHRLIWGDDPEPDWVSEELIDYELGTVEAAERESRPPPLDTRMTPGDPLGLDV